MATPLQPALLAFILALFFVDLAFGLHHVVPFMWAGLSDATILRSKIPSSVRTDIMVPPLSDFSEVGRLIRGLLNPQTFHRSVASLPQWAHNVMYISYASLIVIVILNIATDAAKRSIHVLTLIMTFIGSTPLIVVLTGPALRIAAKGKRLTPAEEIQAIYDIALLVVMGAVSAVFALLLNLSTTQDETVEKPTTVKKRAVRVEKVADKIE
ncbi:hypothetical protein HK101_004592 [Irineochytrium annulatum]|nr:hypothetical protein HK101_004592 [Irineochytrium annulatum]